MEKLTERINALLSRMGYYLYDVTYTKEDGENVLRIMIENDSHITLDDCVLVSRELSDMLDEEDPFSDPYNMEVTSAGAEHILHTQDHIKRAVNKDVYLETFDQKITGKLIQYKNGILTIKVSTKTTTKIDEMDINLIRLAIVL